MLKAEIKARKHRDKTLGDALAASTAGATADISALAQKLETALTELDKKYESVLQDQQQLHLRQDTAAADHAALDKVSNLL